MFQNTNLELSSILVIYSLYPVPELHMILQNWQDSVLNIFSSSEMLLT